MLCGIEDPRPSESRGQSLALSSRQPLYMWSRYAARLTFLSFWDEKCTRSQNGDKVRDDAGPNGNYKNPGLALECGRFCKLQSSSLRWGLPTSQAKVPRRFGHVALGSCPAYHWQTQSTSAGLCRLQQVPVDLSRPLLTNCHPVVIGRYDRVLAPRFHSFLGHVPR